MAGFANSFWSSDYAGGLGVLFGKLQQGVHENEQLLTIARMRAEAEDSYGQRLADIGPATSRVNGGFSRDDGASVKKAYEGVRNEMQQASESHKKIASNIRELVVNPFGRWCEAHAIRVQNSQDDLQSRIKAHDRQAEAVQKLRSQYFNKCRQVEDLEEEDKLAFKDPQSDAAQSQSPKPQKIPSIKVPEPEDPEEQEPVDIGDESYTPEQLRKILTHMLETIKRGEVKVPILGVYQNVSSGADITEYIQKHMNGASLSYAERIGQDLVERGFLRLVGNVGKTFANSSKMNYKWQPKVFQITGILEPKKPLGRAGSVLSSSVLSTISNDSAEGIASPIVGAVGEYLGGWNPLNNAHPNETPSERLRREAREADERYKAGVRKLDTLRCTLEEAMVDHLKFMERCELDRLKAIKAVILDFSGAISNVIPSLQRSVDNMMLFQETIQPLGDLRYLLENYRTGGFMPKVQVYENYYHNVDEQTFGVDLEARARADHKRVPIIVTTILTFLDHHYPDLDGDEVRRGIWLVDVPLAATHHLRNALNTGKSFSHEILEKYEIPIVASVLKLYLLELPDSLVSSHLYEIIKTIYTTAATEASEANRVQVIQNTLGQLRLANIATLDAIMTHFTRIINLTSADEEYKVALATTLAPCILRPRLENTLTMGERFSYRLIRDLFDHKDAIFGELKRASSLNHKRPEAGRPRAISSDESSRRANQEERVRAIVSRSRASSPQPGAARVHRRDRSSGGPETRFPIQTSPTDRRGAGPARQGLEVPAQPEFTTSADSSSGQTNGTSSSAPAQPVNPSEPSHDTASSATPMAQTEVEKRNSLGRSAAVPASSRFPRKVPPGGLTRQSLVGSKRDSTGSLHSLHDGIGEHRPVAFELTDKPMDD